MDRNHRKICKDFSIHSQRGINQTKAASGLSRNDFVHMPTCGIPATGSSVPLQALQWAVQTGTKHLWDPYKILLRVAIVPSFGNGKSLWAFRMHPNFSLCAGSALCLLCAGELDFNHFPFPAYLCSLLFIWPTMPFIPCPLICICEQRASLCILFSPSVGCVRLRDTVHLSSWLVLLVMQNSELRICHKLKKRRAFFALYWCVWLSRAEYPGPAAFRALHSLLLTHQLWQLWHFNSLFGIYLLDLRLFFPCSFLRTHLSEQPGFLLVSAFVTVHVLKGRNSSGSTCSALELKGTDSSRELCSLVRHVTRGDTWGCRRCAGHCFNAII